MAGRTVLVPGVLVLLATACSRSDESAAVDNGVVGTVTTVPVGAGTTLESLPYDDPPLTTGEDSGSSSTVLGSIVPPEESGGTTTTAAGATTTAAGATSTQGQGPTTAPATTDPKQDRPPASDDALLACANVELGLLAELSGSDGSDHLRTGGEMAVATGDAPYASLGQGLLDAIDAGTGELDAADALLDECEIDGFERLA